MTFQDRRKQFGYWLRNIEKWLWEARHVFIAIFVVLIAIFIICLSGGNEAAIRTMGMGLQLSGICTVIWGIGETRRLFGRPSIVFSLQQWLKRFPPYGGRAFTASGTSILPGISASGRAHMLAKADPNGSVESRIEVLEKNIELLHKRIDATENEMDSRSHKQKQALEEEAKIREGKDQKIHAKLEATETGGLHISAMGALWLFVGVILSSIPNELSGLFN